MGVQARSASGPDMGSLTYLIGVWPDQEGSRHTNGPCIALRLERW